MHPRRYELFFAIDIKFATTFTQLIGNNVENRGVVADVIWRKCSGSHYAGNFDISHRAMKGKRMRTK